MTSTEIDIRQDGAVAGHDDTDSWVAIASDVFKLAAHICDTSFVPKTYRGDAPAVAAAILAGRELGLPPMTALRHVQVVEGSPSLSAEYKRARVLAAGHEFDIIERTTTKCRVSGRRRGSHKPPLIVEYTVEDARRARLIKDRGAYETRPRRMLFARASTELCDALFSDVTNGLPTTEELQDGDLPDGEAETAPATENGRPHGRVTVAEITGRGPAAPETEDPPAGDQPGSVSPAQLTKLHTVLTGLGFTGEDREHKLIVAEMITGRAPLHGPTQGRSSKNLSLTEAGKLIDTLDGFDGDRDQLIAYMAEREQDGGGDE